MTYLRLMKSDDPFVDAYKEAAYLIPLETFLIPLGTIIYLRLSRKRRRNDINGMVKLTTQGERGYENYATILSRQWNRKR
ncbi:hypothetical protein OESDEN_06667 [Oesophagostomum dentatum]|uniref:Uncharacterized protein n=1 Tax=Oesophagostomum dentatum TaxID=61180 RepID=A0A0B1TDH6_OESDE|nr:hypothetical protein OESDEN_06667 [Oesophagostomum dentatum]